MELEIALDQIEIPAGRRAVDPAAVERLSESISAVGLQHRVTVSKRNGVYRLIAGAHRVAAFSKLGRARIPASVIELNALESEILEIDENLCRNELSVAERAAATARRKAIYLQLHPETRQGGAVGGGGGAVRFTKVTAEATGRSERVVQRDAARGEALGGPTLAKIAHTSLDSGVEIDALSKLPPDQRQVLVDQAASGDDVSAQDVVSAVWSAKAAAGVVKVDAAVVSDDELDPDEVEFLAKADAAIAAAHYPGKFLYASVIDKQRKVIRVWQDELIKLEREWQASGKYDHPQD